MNRRLFKVSLILIFIVVLVFSFSSCANGFTGGSSLSLGNDGDNSALNLEYYKNGVEEFSKENSEVILTRNGTVFFLTADGEVYGAGKNNNWELGLATDREMKKAVKVPIDEKIEKIVPINKQVFFFSESGSIYRTGKIEGKEFFKYTNIKEESSEELYKDRYPKQLDLTDFSERIVSISLSSEEEVAHLVGENGKVYICYSSEEYKEISLPEKIVKSFAAGEEVFFLSNTNKLYSLENKEGAVVQFVAENVSAVETNNFSTYYISSGTVYGKGDVHKWLPKGTGFEESEILYTNKFRALNLPEKAVYITRYTKDANDPYAVDGIAFIGESGKVYAIQKAETGNGGYTYSVESVYTVENIENISAIKTTKVESLYDTKNNGSKYEYAIKYKNEGWKVRYVEEVDGFLAGELVPIYELPEWK